MSVVAVSGIGGFIGSVLSRRLETLGYSVLGLGHDLDLTNSASVAGLSKVDAVIHLAARTYVPESWQNPHRFFRENYLATLNLLELARLHKAPFVLAGSYVYGIPQYLPIDELHPTSAPNPYAGSKLLSENLCASLSSTFRRARRLAANFQCFRPGPARSNCFCRRLCAGWLKAASLLANEARGAISSTWMMWPTLLIAALNYRATAIRDLQYRIGQKCFGRGDRSKSYARLSGNTCEVHYEKPHTARGNSRTCGQTFAKPPKC